jgi:hypothetical protein
MLERLRAFANAGRGGGGGAVPGAVRGSSSADGAHADQRVVLHGAAHGPQDAPQQQTVLSVRNREERCARENKRARLS